MLACVGMGMVGSWVDVGGLEAWADVWYEGYTGADGCESVMVGGAEAEQGSGFYERDADGGSVPGSQADVGLPSSQVDVDTVGVADVVCGAVEVGCDVFRGGSWREG